MRHRIPYTLSSLTRCVEKAKCHPWKKHLFTHYYVSTAWLLDLKREKFPSVYKYKCWKNIYQEPYLMVQRNDSITHFFEAYINYGFNKISYVETLRTEGESEAGK